MSRFSSPTKSHPIQEVNKVLKWLFINNSNRYLCLGGMVFVSDPKKPVGGHILVGFLCVLPNAMYSSIVLLSFIQPSLFISNQAHA